jgi:hypothetical protein
MTKTFTPNDIIRYIYHETPEEESQLISQNLLTDSELQAFYLEMLAITNEIHTIDIGPSELVIQNILGYSRNFVLHAVK